MSANNDKKKRELLRELAELESQSSTSELTVIIFEGQIKRVKKEITIIK